MSAKLRIEIANEQRRLRIPRRRLEQGVAAAFRLAGQPPGLLSFAFVDDRRMRALHRRHLGIDTPTDVLSFPLDADEHPDPDEAPAVGEIVVSTDTAARCARDLGHSPTQEVLLYALHGTLHLLGFDDHGPRPSARMRAAERECLRAAGVEQDLFAAPRKDLPSNRGRSTMR